MAESNRSTKSMAALSHLDVEYLRQEYEKHAIPWYRNQHQQLISLKHIAIMLCAHSEHFRKSNKHVSPFKIKDELPVKSLRFLEPQKLFVCAGDRDLAAALRMELSHKLTWPNCNLTWVNVVDEIDASTTLLVYLHRDIWAQSQHDPDDDAPISLLRRVLLQKQEDDELAATPWKAFIDQERIYEAQQLLAKSLAKGHEQEGWTPLHAKFQAEYHRQRLSTIHTAASAISRSSDLEEYTSRRLRVRKVVLVHEMDEDKHGMHSLDWNFRDVMHDGVVLPRPPRDLMTLFQSIALALVPCAAGTRVVPGEQHIMKNAHRQASLTMILHHLGALEEATDETNVVQEQSVPFDASLKSSKRLSTSRSMSSMRVTPIVAAPTSELS